MAKRVVVSLIPLYVAVTAAASTVSISTFPPLSAQHGCVVNCLWPPPFATGDLGHGLGCDWSFVNDCYCATASATQASGFLSSCVNAQCSSGDLPGDVNSAISVYGIYCLTAGYTIPGVEAFITTPASPAATGKSNLPTATSNIPAQATSGSTGDHLSEPAEIATIIGSIVGVIGLVVAVYYGRAQVRSRRAEREQH